MTVTVDELRGWTRDGELDASKRHFAPVIAQIRAACEQLQIHVEANETTGLLTFSGEGSSIDAIMDTITVNQLHEDCHDSHTLMLAATGPLEVADANITAIQEHIQSCAHCSWLKRAITTSDAENGDIITKDARIFA